MKQLILLSFILLFAGTSFGQFNIAGTATGGGGAFNLTPSTGCGFGQAGAIWNTPPTPNIDFTQSFTLTFDAQFDNNPGAADGICAVFGSNILPGSVNNNGGYLGYYDVSGGPTNPAFQQSLGVEFDFFYNSSTPYLHDISDDHTQISVNADPSVPLAGPISILPGAVTVKDGANHHYIINWDCSLQQLTVTVDGSLRLSTFLTGANAPSAIFALPSSVIWGFTGATASYCSNEFVHGIHLNQTPCCPPQPNVCVTLTSTVPYIFNFTSSSPTATIYYYPVNSLGIPVGPVCSLSTPFILSFATLNSTYPGAYGVQIVGVCDGGCCWGLTTSTPSNPPLPGGCKAILNHPRYANPASVTQISNGNDLQVIPSPNKGTFTLSGETGEITSTKVAIDVIDIFGKTVYSDVATVDKGVLNKNISLGDNIANGIYLVKISGDNVKQVIRFTLNR